MMTEAINDRIYRAIRPFAWILTLKGSLAISILGWLATALISESYLGMGYCWTGVFLVLVSIQVERQWLNITPFPPLTILLVSICMKWIIGGAILQLSEPLHKQDVFVDYIVTSLPLNLIPCSIILLCGIAVNSSFLKQNPPASVSLVTLSKNQKFIHVISCITYLTSIIAIGYILIGTVSGTLDRGSSFGQWAGLLWRPDTLLSAFIRLRDIFFLCFPLFIIIHRRKPHSLFLAIITCAILIVSGTLGGRGLLIYPLILLTGGLWLSQVNANLVKSLIIFISLGSLLFAFFIGQMRKMPEFKSTSSTNIIERVSVAYLAATKLSFANSAIYIRQLGIAIYSQSDPYLFTESSRKLPPVNAKRLENLKYIWIPKILKPDKPEINDGFLIANEIRGKKIKPGRKQKSFHNVSFGADLYWRFRWVGVVIGGLLFGLIYALICRLWYMFAELGESTIRTFILLFPATFLQGPPLRSVSETIWNWLYELPKYLIVILLISILIDFIVRRTKLH